MWRWSDGGRLRGLGLGLGLGTALVTSAVLPTGVLGEGHDARLEADPSRVAAGGAVTVHGIYFGDSGAVPLELVDGSGASIPLGTATADDSGEFWLVVTIPASARPGAFVLRAVAPDGDGVEGALQVDPAAPERGDQRGADEPLLVPMGSLPPGPAIQPVTGSSPAAVEPAADAVSIVVAIGMALVVASVLGGLIRIRSRRSSAAPTGTRDLP